VRATLHFASADPALRHLLGRLGSREKHGV
jgi:hypothetical protein